MVVRGACLSRGGLSIALVPAHSRGAHACLARGARWVVVLGGWDVVVFAAHDVIFKERCLSFLMRCLNI